MPGDHARSNALPARCQLPDLVGSTALSAKLDPEDLRSVIGRLSQRCHCRSRSPALGEDPTPANFAARREEGTSLCRLSRITRPCQIEGASGLPARPVLVPHPDQVAGAVRRPLWRGRRVSAVSRRRQYGMELSPSFLDGRGLPQVNRVIGLRFWLEAENHFVTTSAGICFDLLRECREKKPVQPSARRFGTQR